MLKKRVQDFIDALDLPKSRLAKQVGITGQSISLWLKGDLKLSDDTEKRIDQFLKKFNY